MTKDERLKELFKGTDLQDLAYEGYDNADNLIDDLEQQISEEEIIYYSRAMEYLMENDNSLKESLEIAEDMGHTSSSLSSEILATILYQQNLHNELNDLRSDIEDIFDEEDYEIIL